jgi:flagellar basal-body rod modification protein FlgD
MTTIANDVLAKINGTPTKSTKDQMTEASDRFLKLLVTQMQNQDPLNPMDNAQVTSQMAQISTVTGIEKLNTSISSMTSQFTQMQALQGAALVGRDITIEGTRVDIADGKGYGGFELAGTADTVKVEVLSPAGRVVDSMDLGSLKAGRHGFEWSSETSAAIADNTAGYTFRVTAKSGTAAVTSTPLVVDRVLAVSTEGGALTLTTQHSGDVAYTDVKAFN